MDKLGLGEHVGGIPAPSTVSWAINEFMVGALPAGFFYLAGPAFAGYYFENGNEGRALGQNGRRSQLGGHHGPRRAIQIDVGAAASKAIEQPDGSWHIEGDKRFITSGDSDDLFENIFHYTLARPEGAGPGTKGLSLFIVPKFLFDSETGRNRRTERCVRNKTSSTKWDSCVSHLRPDIRGPWRSGQRLARRRRP